MKPCSRCKMIKPLSNYNRDRNRITGLSNHCRECQKVFARTWYLKTRQARQQKLRTMKRIIFEKYGNKCVCCGINNPKFLTIDHVNNDGYLVEKSGKTRLAGTTIYPKVVKLNFPPSYQLLCWNCNCGKAYNKGICPHKENY